MEVKSNETFLNALDGFLKTPEQATYTTTQEPRHVEFCHENVKGCLDESSMEISLHHESFDPRNATFAEITKYTKFLCAVVKNMPLKDWKYFVEMTLDDDSVEFNFLDNGIMCIFQCHCCADCMLSDIWKLKRVEHAECILIVQHYVKSDPRFLTLKESMKEKKKDFWMNQAVPLTVEQAHVLCNAVQKKVDEKMEEAIQKASDVRSCIADLLKQ